MRRYLRHPVVHNALALYGIQFAEYVLPMITVPYLARVLLPAGWGLVVFAQGFSGWLSLVLEYGFGFSATREIARSRDDPEHSAKMVAGVVGANILLLIAATVVSFACYFLVPSFHANPIYLWLAFVIALTQGIRPLWYFQGLEQMTFPAWLNVAGRLGVTVGIFLWVKTADSGWKVLALQSIAGVIVSGIILAAMYRKIPFRRPSLDLSIQALQTGWTMFLSRSAISLYTMANIFILGLFTNTTEVAYYGGAERINRAVLGLLQPISQALYPRMSNLALRNKERAAEAARLGLIVFGGFGLLAGAGLALLAPIVIRILLGAEYQPAVMVFRVLTLIVPLIALSNVLGIQWMLPFGMDRAFNRIILGAGVLNVCLAVYLAPRFGSMGMAWSVVAAEGFVTLGMWFVLRRSGREFWTRKQEQEA